MEKMIFKKINAIALNVIVTLFSITCIFPIIWMFYSSLKSNSEFTLNILSLPTKFHFENYVKAVVEGNIMTYFMNSVLNTVITVFLATIISFVTGYCLSRFEFKGKTTIYYMFLAGMIVPIYAILIPLFLEFKTLGILNNKYTLLIPYIAFALPMAIFLIESFVKTIPREMEEAACIDGASFSYTMFFIIMPMCKPVLATSAILTFLNTWNEFPLALVLISKTSLKTMTIGLTNFIGTYTVNYPLMLAALVVSTTPVVIMYLLFYNQIMNGMMAGAVKG